MNYLFRTNILFFLILTFSGCQRTAETKPFDSCWNLQPDRIWIGPEFWANRLQDWCIHKGRLECINGTGEKRTLHILTHYLTQRPGSLSMRIETDLVKAINRDAGLVYGGFLLGAGTEDMDFRRRALIHGACGNHGGLIAAFNLRGELLLIDNSDNSIIARAEAENPFHPEQYEKLLLSLELVPRGGEYDIIITAGSSDGKTQYNRLQVSLGKNRDLGGNLAIISNGGHFGFSQWKIRGTKVKYNKDQIYGPVMGTQYTISDNILKMTAQMPPVGESDEPEVELQLMDRESGKWINAAGSQIQKPGYTAGFKIEGWKSGMPHDYRVVYHVLNDKGTRVPCYHYGTIVRDPVDKEVIVAAVFTGNSNTQEPIGKENFNFDHIWFPHEELTDFVAKHDPDLLVFTGNNVYEDSPTPPDYSTEGNSELDYLYKWYLFLWAHGNLTRNIPTVTIPGNHDVYQSNLWGSGGIRAPEIPDGGMYPRPDQDREARWQEDQGGYRMSAAFVNMVQRTQTGHLPDPYDPEPAEQGIGVFYCNLSYGRISWAVLEDRKFKSAPAEIHPGLRIISGFPQTKIITARMLDSPDASLLGERQLAFLREWAGNWKGADMKVAISQSIFAGLSSFPDTFMTDSGMPGLQPLPRGEVPGNYIKAKDLGSDGWPQTGRDKAIGELRKGFALMIGGDLNFGSVVHHGIDDWEDAGCSFSAPAIANPLPRGWFPSSPGENHMEDMPPYTGRFTDGLGNKVTVMAVSNPYISEKVPAVLYDRAPGYGIVRLNRNTQLITLECWPRHTDPGSINAEQYPGWPVTLQMQDNYAREPSGWLPVFRISGLDRPPVIQVINEITGETIYTLRIRNYEYQPHVFRAGTYSVTVGEPGTNQQQTLTGLISSDSRDQHVIDIDF